MDELAAQLVLRHLSYRAAINDGVYRFPLIKGLKTGLPPMHSLVIHPMNECIEVRIISEREKELEKVLNNV